MRVFLGRLFAIGCVALVCVLTNCTQQAPVVIPEETCAIDLVTVVSFQQDVVPILQSKCYECHAANGTFAFVLTLDTYSGVKSKVDDGKLRPAVSHEPGATPMPYQRERIPSCQVKTIQKWIEQGALNN